MGTYSCLLKRAEASQICTQQHRSASFYNPQWTQYNTKTQLRDGPVFTLSLFFKLWEHQQALIPSVAHTTLAQAQRFSAIVFFFPVGLKQAKQVQSAKRPLQT